MFSSQKPERMPPKKRARKASGEVTEEPFTHSTRDEKSEGSALHLEESASHDDADALLALAESCALGAGTEQDVERARTLLSEAAGKGSKEAKSLTKVIGQWRGQETVDLSRLSIKSSLEL